MRCYRFRRIALAALTLALAAQGWALERQAPLSFNDALGLALQGAPQLAAQNAAVSAAQQSAVGAGELPDPKLVLGIENLPVEGADRFRVTRDFMTMRKVGVMQDFTRGDKLKLRGERAAAEVRKEEALLAMTEIDLRRDTALAWIDTYFAERQIALLKELGGETRLHLSAAEAALAGGKGAATEPFAVRLALAQIDDRLIDADRQASRARAGLARWVGVAAARELGKPPAFDRLDPRHAEWAAHLEQLPHLAMFVSMQAMADTEVKLAQAAKYPDWSVEVSYAQRGPDYSNMLSIGVRIDLPIFQTRRQDPAIAAKVAMVEQVRAQTEAARREHEAAIRAWLADWRAAKARMQRFESIQMPLARERTEIAMAAYRGGKGDLMPVIDARKAEIDTRTGYLQAEADLARAWAQLNFLFLETHSKDRS